LAVGLGLVGATSGRAQSKDATYPIDAFVLSYGHSHPGQPPLSQLQDLEVPLVLSGGVYTAPTGKPLAVTKIRLSSPPAGAVFTQAGLQAVLEGVVRAFNRRGIYGAFVVPRSEEIDPETGVDNRPAGRHALKLVIWVGEIGSIRMLDKGAPLKGGLRHRLVAGSPLHGQATGQPGSLVNRLALEDYLWRLNDHPGRRVEASLTSTNDPGVIALDYLVDQSRPWSVLAQVSNTGTESTGVTRTRLSFLSNEVTGRDDIFSLDYFTTNITGSEAVFASYQKPLLYPNWLLGRLFGSWGNFNSQPVGIAFERFSGKNWDAGGELAAVLGRPLGITVSPVAGIEWQYFGVKSPTFGQSGSVNLLLPYLGLDLRRNSTHTEVANGFRFETNITEATSTTQSELESLGRLDVNVFWWSLRDDFRASLFLDGLFTSHPVDRTNELYFAASGQFVPSSYRLIPQELDVVGGFFSVRGYPEEITSGDSGFVSTLEYRFHVPGMAAHLAKLNRALHLRDRTAANFADWDVLFRVFTDLGQTYNNRIQPGEINYTLLSTGAGVELTLSRHFDVRLDEGYALRGVATQLQTLAEKDSFRTHVIATISW
jgi:hypothetical protein